MQPHDTDQRTEESDIDGRRHAEWRALEDAIVMAHSVLSSETNGQVHLAEEKTVNLFANVRGSGNVN